MTGAANTNERNRWYESLRQRYLSLARRRVEPDAVEDVVQEALRVVFEREGIFSRDTEDGLPPLAWCFQVLRNTIGNHYQKRRTRSREQNIDTAYGLSHGKTPLEALQESESETLIHALLATLEETDPQCARYLQRLAEGEKPAEVAEREKLRAAVFYRRIYRCRGKLRELMREEGVTA